jgi:hypothetical protein
MADFVIGSFNCRWGAFRNDKRKEETDRDHVPIKISISLTS